MDHPDLMIFNVLTWEPIWGLNPVRYLNSVKEDEIKINGDRISQDKSFITFDRLSNTYKDGEDDFIYMSSKNGLEFKYQSMFYINNITISNKILYINNSPTIKNNVNMELKYNSKFDKLMIKNDTCDNVWELYGLKKCDMLISIDDDCNTIYSYNQLNLTLDSFDDNNYNKVALSLYNNKLFYTSIDNDNELYQFDLSEYTKIDDPIFSLTLSSSGDIILDG